MSFLEAATKTAAMIIGICFCISGACADICEDDPNAKITAIVGMVAFAIVIAGILFVAAIHIASFWGLV